MRAEELIERYNDGADLSGVDLRGADLRNANLSGADLNGVLVSDGETTYILS